jgi:hypothetical protein
VDTTTTYGAACIAIPALQSNATQIEMVCTQRTPRAIEEQIERPGWQERLHLAVILRLEGWMLMRQGIVRSRAQLRASIH